MNKANLKSYAPQARLDFIAAVTARANILGIAAQSVSAIEVRGDLAFIDGREWPAKIAGQREKLLARIKRHGFGQTMEEIAYTWFNRFSALRFMELHDYIDHGWRVLSSRDGGLPEILLHASELELSGLSRDNARNMQLAGNQDDELYKLLLVAQCNELSLAMPFLFERIDDETELLLPENLLRTDSLLAKLVDSVPEKDWADIEAIGWLYQFYISAKKDQVIGSIVKSEDIPAATQLFTPNWIVKFLVQNSVGRLWTMANPDSSLSSGWSYYATPAEHPVEVAQRLDALRLARVTEDGGILNPETITVLDPACGSGHILVVAYDALKEIYLERGYQPRAIPRLILEKNIYGIDIDDRAAQLAGFALLMRARADDRRLFVDPPKLNVLSMQESGSIDIDEVASHLAPYHASRSSVKGVVDLFKNAKTFGSLIQVPSALETELPALATALGAALESGDLYAQAAARDMLPLAAQALALATRFDAVIANPPYMGGKGMNATLKDFAKTNYPDSKSDLFAMFIERGFAWCKPLGFNSMVTMQSWMFLSAYETMRSKLLKERSIIAMAHLGARAFTEISGEIVQTTAFTMLRQHVDGYRPSFFRLTEGLEEDKAAALRGKRNLFNASSQEEFAKIPGSPIAYWLGDAFLAAFDKFAPLGEVSQSRVGMNTTNNSKFVRLWPEVSFAKIGVDMAAAEARASDQKWFPYNKGGGFRRWYGNNYSVVNYENDGKTICDYIDFESGGNVPSSGRVISRDKYFRPAITWSSITSSFFSARKCGPGFVFDNGGASTFSEDELQNLILGFLCTNLAFDMLRAINPTLNFQPGNIASLPFPIDRLRGLRPAIDALVDELVAIHKADWDRGEFSWIMAQPAMLSRGAPSDTLELGWKRWAQANADQVARVVWLEQELNRIYADAYELTGSVSLTVSEDQITLMRADPEKDCQRLISYAVGCMMGRFSLDEPGLAYASAGNADFDPDRYVSFQANDAGIVMLTDEPWFTNDAASRAREFLLAALGTDALDENIAWLAQSLGAKSGEMPDEAIRRYLADKFYKDHLQTYKKRPIYWLFSSGKQGAFQALVYLHRYNESTLARMRSEYVIPLSAKLASRLEILDRDIGASVSTASRAKIQKQIESLRKKQSELLAYDEKLRHYAEQRISIDLDDGVKANYAKFGDLLADSKSIAGGAGA